MSIFPRKKKVSQRYSGLPGLHRRAGGLVMK
jgi:hypothetical protein